MRFTPKFKENGMRDLGTKAGDTLVARTVKDGNAPYIKGCEAEQKFSL